MRRQIERLLGSEISAYAIAKKSGVPYSTISDLRTGKRTVALLVSAWIEIRMSLLVIIRSNVALLVSAWIEI